MRHLRLENVTTDTEVNILLVLALGPLRDLVLRHLPAKSAGLLWTEVKRLELLALVELTHVRTLLEVDNSKNTRNVLADGAAEKSVLPSSITRQNSSIGVYVHASELTRGTTGHLLNSELKQLLAQLSHLVQKVRLRLVLKILSANLGLRRLR